MAEMKLKPASEGHKPKGAHGRAAVEAIGRTKTTGNFKRIEEAKGKGAAIAAYQNKLKANHNGPKAHTGSNGLHYGAHEAHEAITSQGGHDCKG
jgi:hypothetical protein